MMNLKINSVWIFVLIVLLLLFCALFPTPSFIMAATLIGSALIVLQAYLILKDDVKHESET